MVKIRLTRLIRPLLHFFKCQMTIHATHRVQCLAYNKPRKEKGSHLPDDHTCSLRKVKFNVPKIPSTPMNLLLPVENELFQLPPSQIAPPPSPGN